MGSLSYIIRLNSVHYLIACLKDADSDVRKYAAFAIGNLVFHSDFFYPQVGTPFAKI
jgi:hypothetical protein